jgi:ABC-type lipoprotein release transport system permease subunit
MKDVQSKHYSDVPVVDCSQLVCEVFTGALPAVRASRVDLLVALRYE